MYPILTDMGDMFHDTLSFYQDVSKWYVSNVTDMSCMFSIQYLINP